MKSKILKHLGENILQGLFWLLPIGSIIIIVVWLYNKIDSLVNNLFEYIGFLPQNNEVLWVLLVIVIFLGVLYTIGHFIQTKLANIFESLFEKIPIYSTIKDIINIFNSSKDGERKVLVVAIAGFTKEGFNIGLMYSQKESIIKDHYTVTLSQTPIPNGGYMFEVHKENIFIIEEASFDDNLQYLLSMGVKSLTEILKVESKTLEELIPLTSYLEQKSKTL